MILAFLLETSTTRITSDFLQVRFPRETEGEAGRRTPGGMYVTNSWFSSEAVKFTVSSND